MSLASSTISEEFTRLRREVEAALKSELQLSEQCPATLRESMEYSLLGGGKRFRPILALLACEACGADYGSAMPAACALEMVHTYSLVHDDLPAMDDDDMRRGRPTNHVRFGQAMAILAGDALLTLAFEVIAKHYRKEPEVAANCCFELAAAAGPEGMVGGQTADLSAEIEPVTELNQLEMIHRRKTGRLITASLVMGGHVAKADPRSLAALTEYGNSVGLAFQIADDLLDSTGNPEKMGKSVGKDSDRGKATYPGLMGIEESRERAVKLIENAIASSRVFGPNGAKLEAMARFVIEREH